ncbi:hypothetical protein OK016_28500 [Vibrio chagasii]|nr:hypothetical protein [Vibrio chagasii]
MKSQLDGVITQDCHQVWLVESDWVKASALFEGIIETTRTGNGGRKTSSQ